LSTAGSWIGQDRHGLAYRSGMHDQALFSGMARKASPSVGDEYRLRANGLAKCTHGLRVASSGF